MKDKNNRKKDIFLFCVTTLEGYQKEGRLFMSLARNKNSKHLSNLHGLFSNCKCASVPVRGYSLPLHTFPSTHTYRGVLDCWVGTELKGLKVSAVGKETAALLFLGFAKHRHKQAENCLPATEDKIRSLKSWLVASQSFD